MASPKTLECKDFDPSCNWKVESENENEIVSKATDHAREHHGMKEISQEFMNKIRSLIKTKGTEDKTKVA